MEKILTCPVIKDNDKTIGYGGNQEWFADEWAKKAGCASVSANDIYAYYLDTKKEYKKQEYITLMENMFEIMTPKSNGFPYAYLYARKLRLILQNIGIQIKYKILRNPNTEVSMQIVQQAIDAGNPLGLLILKHRESQLQDDVWHWVTIFGYRHSPEGMVVIISNYGEKKEILARILFENHCLNYFKLVMFDKQ